MNKNQQAIAFGAGAGVLCSIIIGRSIELTRAEALNNSSGFDVYTLLIYFWIWGMGFTIFYFVGKSLLSVEGRIKDSDERNFYKKELLKDKYKKMNDKK